MALSEKEKKDEFVKHSEIKTHESKAKETVRGSARHSSKFSNERAIIEDNSKKIEAIIRLSNHVEDLEKRVTALEGSGEEEPPKK